MTYYFYLAMALYGAGAIGTLIYNLQDMVYISRPLVILRNMLLWPVFLPILILIKEKS